MLQRALSLETRKPHTLAAPENMSKGSAAALREELRKRKTEVEQTLAESKRVKGVIETIADERRAASSTGVESNDSTN